MPSTSPTSPAFVPAARPTSGRGTAIVIGLLLLGLVAAGTGIWYQRGQTRRCLDLYGAEAARHITAAPRVELVRLVSAGAAGRLAAVDRRDITSAKGLVHLRRGLVEDANFLWPSAATENRLPENAWDLGLVFSDPALPEQPPTILVIDFDESGGHAAVVGRPGRVGLGRLEKGLRKWVEAL
jgi:hypothetical protein